MTNELDTLTNPARQVLAMLLSRGEKHRYTLNTKTIAKRLGFGNEVAAELLHTLSSARRNDGTRGYVARTYKNAHEAYTAVTWSLVDNDATRALAALCAAAAAVSLVAEKWSS